MRLCALTLTSFSVASTSIRSFSKIESCVFMIKLFWATLPLCWEFVKQALDLKVRPSALGSYSKEKGIQFGAEHLIRFSTKLSLSLNHGAKVRIFPFLPNFCDESSGKLCSVYFQNTIGHNMSNKYYSRLERIGTKYFELNVPLNNTPVSVARLKNFSDICSVKRLCRLILHIVKVFFASPYMKMWKFS